MREERAGFPPLPPHSALGHQTQTPSRGSPCPRGTWSPQTPVNQVSRADWPLASAPRPGCLLHCALHRAPTPVLDRRCQVRHLSPITAAGPGSGPSSQERWHHPAGLLRTRRPRPSGRAGPHTRGCCLRRLSSCAAGPWQVAHRTSTRSAETAPAARRAALRCEATARPPGRGDAALWTGFALETQKRHFSSFPAAAYQAAQLPCEFGFIEATVNQARFRVKSYSDLVRPRHKAA